MQLRDEGRWASDEGVSRLSGRSKPECHVWTVLKKDNIVAGREFNFRSGRAPIALLALLYVVTSHNSVFTVPDDVAEYLGWRPSRLIAARRQLVRAGYLEIVRRAGRKRAAIYCWS
jgi:hypothetical protein